ncbi:MAG: type I 3-dehydroquinate dehydratase [Methanosarcinales archaeon]|nr:type I 3-dehydroquinate dehydratase [Methanosarcinales archaeon]
MGETSLPGTSILRLGDLALRRPSVVAVIVGDVEDAVNEAARQGADMLEVRLDLIPEEPLEALRRVRKLSRLPIIATNRIRREGGGFQDSEEERAELLIRASAHADLVDVELRSTILSLVRESVKKPLIISYHHFQSAPGREELSGIIREMQDRGADIAKIAATPPALEDCLAMLETLIAARIPTCMLGMGEVGRHLRIMAPCYGSVLTYGYITGQTAPGQMRVDELVEALRILALRQPF